MRNGSAKNWHAVSACRTGGFTTSASDANRAVIRIARTVTGREKVLVFNGCYHGSVEEAHGQAAADALTATDGRLDVLIHNAGGCRRTELEAIDAQILEETLSLNLKSCFCSLKPRCRRLSAARPAAS